MARPRRLWKRPTQQTGSKGVSIRANLIDLSDLTEPRHFARQGRVPKSPDRSTQCARSRRGDSCFCFLDPGIRVPNPRPSTKYLASSLAEIRQRRSGFLRRNQSEQGIWVFGEELPCELHNAVDVSPVRQGPSEPLAGPVSLLDSSPVAITKPAVPPSCEVARGSGGSTWCSRFA